MLNILQILVILFFLLSLISCIQIFFSYLFYYRQLIYLKKMSVWHMYIDSGGLEKTTIGIFEDAEKGLQFIRSFGFKQDVYFVHSGTLYTKSNMYSLEFTAKEAIDNGFLDMYKVCFLESGGEQRIMVHTLCLEEAELNKQLVFALEGDE